MQAGVAQLQGVAIAKKEFSILHLPEIAAVIVQDPHGFRGDLTGGKRECESANVALVMLGLAGSWRFAGNEAGDAEGEEEIVFIEKIE